MDLAPLLRRFCTVGSSGILLKWSLLSAKVATDPRNLHGVQDVTAVNALVKFYPLTDKKKGVLPVAKIPAKTITDFRFWRCSTIEDVHQLLSFWWLWACSMANSFSSMNRISSQFRGVTRRRSRRHLSSHARWSAVRTWTHGAIRRTDPREIPVSRAIFRIDTVEFRWTWYIYMSWRFQVVLIGGFLPLLGWSPYGRAPGTVWWSSWH